MTVELSPATAEAYIRDSFGKMLVVAERLGDGLVNEQPVGPATNSVAVLITHCCGVTGFWLGHVVLGDDTDRDRDAEFVASATVAELRALIDATVASASEHLRRIDAGESTPDSPMRNKLDVDDPSDTSIVVHVIEELYQHLGHMDLTADVLLKTRLS